MTFEGDQWDVYVAAADGSNLTRIMDSDSSRKGASGRRERDRWSSLSSPAASGHRRSGSSDQPTAEHVLGELERLVGEWIFEATWPDERSGRAAGVSRSSGRLEGASIERGTVELPEAPDNISIIGCDGATGRTSSCTPTIPASAASMG